MNPENTNKNGLNPQGWILDAAKLARLDSKRDPEETQDMTTIVERLEHEAAKRGRSGLEAKS